MSAVTELPEVVAATTAQYLDLIDKALPGQVAGLYLTGSVSLGDFHPGTSEHVKEVHAALPAKPAYDVTYLSARLETWVVGRGLVTVGVW